MRSRFIGTLAFGLSCVLLLGCFGRNPPDADTAAPTRTAPSPTGTPAKDDLVAALRRTQAAPHRFALESNLPENSNVSVAGSFDPSGKLFEATTTVTGGTQAGTYLRIVVGADSYLRERDKKTWVHLDLSRVKKDNSLVYFDMTDPTGLAMFITTIASVERTGPQAYSGKFDPSKQGPRFLPIGAPSLVAFSPRLAPFTAMTDEQNQVVSIRIELAPSTGPKLVMTTTFSEHGKPLSVKAPPKASVREADDVYYK